MTLIGINPIGSSFTEALPDLSGRFRIIQMDRQKDVKIAELIIKGEQAANIRFTRRDELITEAGGSFFIAPWPASAWRSMATSTGPRTSSTGTT
ncbi:hypothetical protein WME73_30595 [Sorangium sp. So ce302]|uniref:hypothetical protein n=1 Tax=unclassified Sorangium TaxID=2621164 RepID=UPI003F5E1E9D